MEKELPKRKEIRLKQYDYSSPGAYFITICTENKKIIFGKVHLTHNCSHGTL